MELKNTLGYLLSQTARNIHVRMNDFFSGYDLTLEQWTALKLIKENSPLCQKELARLNHKNPNTIKALVDLSNPKDLFIVRKTHQTGETLYYRLLLREKPWSPGFPLWKIKPMHCWSPHLQKKKQYL